MYNKTQAKNGLRVVVSPMPQMSSVSLGVWIGIGGRYEQERQSGISHLVEHMLFKGTHTRTTKDLKESIEGVGGSFNGFTSDEVTCYMVKVPSQYMELGVDVLSDMVMNAKFDKDDIAREKFVVCEEIKMYRDQPADHVLDVLSGIMWPGNALGRPLTGSMTTVKRFTRDELIRFKESSYHPGNIAVVASGKVNPEKVSRYAMEKFAGQKKKKKLSFKGPQASKKGPHMKVCRGNTQQTHIAIGFRAQDSNIRERFATKIMNVILGGNMSSRLFEELREKHGLCYDISSTYKRHSDLGEVQIHAGVDTGNTVRSLRAILDELKKLRDLGVTSEELERAKKYAQGQFLLAMEGTSTRMVWLGDRLMTHNNIPDVKDILKRIECVTGDDIKKACSRIFCPEAVNLAMVGKLRDNEKIKVKKELGKL
ncbi:MAG: pitrilysin family protein [Candidatus Omnitrophota bacterium]